MSNPARVYLALREQEVLIILKNYMLRENGLGGRRKRVEQSEGVDKEEETVQLGDRESFRERSLKELLRYREDILDTIEEGLEILQARLFAYLEPAFKEHGFSDDISIYLKRLGFDLDALLASYDEHNDSDEDRKQTDTYKVSRWIAVLQLGLAINALDGIEVSWSETCGRIEYSIRITGIELRKLPCIEGDSVQTKVLGDLQEKESFLLYVHLQEMREVVNGPLETVITEKVIDMLEAAGINVNGGVLMHIHDEKNFTLDTGQDSIRGDYLEDDLKKLTDLPFVCSAVRNGHGGFRIDFNIDQLV